MSSGLVCIQVEVPHWGIKTLPPPHRGPQRCQGDDNVIRNCCHSCWASTSEKGREKSDTALCTDCKGWKTEAERGGQDKNRNYVPFLLLSSNHSLWCKEQCGFPVIQVMGYQVGQSPIRAAELINPLKWGMKSLQTLYKESCWLPIIRQRIQIYIP